jgi:hypothetical protein
MNTRDASGHSAAPKKLSDREIYTTFRAGRFYYGTVAVDGWPTGPCPSQEIALQRVTMYERCEEVSEAAPQQLSRAQMTAAHDWSRGRFRVGIATRDADGNDVYPGASENAEVLSACLCALRAGLHSPAWIEASDLILRLMINRSIPTYVENAGGAMIRRRLPDTAIPTRG